MRLTSDRIAVSRTGGPSASAVAGAVRASAGLAADAKRERNLADLTLAAAGGPAVQLVITGQQTGLAGGPLFTLLKAASAVAIAERIEAESGTRTIPLFWLQSEDHDLAEVLKVALPDREGAVHPIFQADELKQATESRIPLESVDPQVWFTQAVPRLKASLELLPAGAQALDLVDRAFAEKTFARALSVILAEALNGAGLVFFNPRDPELGTELAKIISIALNQRAEIERELENSSAPQIVKIVSGSPIFFYHDSSGQRRRLILDRSSAEWNVGGTGESLSEQALRQIIQTEPGRFSTSALLRPLFEDSIFPTAAYIGGDAEIGYLKQISGLYPLFGLIEPKRIRRWSAAIGERKFQLWLDAAGLSVDDLALDEQMLAGRLAGDSRTSPESLRAGVLSRLAPAIEYLRGEITKIDGTLLNPVEKIERKFSENLDGLIEKYSSALLRADGTAAERISRMKRTYWPNGEAQERSIGMIYFLAKFGIGCGQTILEAARNSKDPAGGAEGLRLYL